RFGTPVSLQLGGRADRLFDHRCRAVRGIAPGEPIMTAHVSSPTDIDGALIVAGPVSESRPIADGGYHRAGGAGRVTTAVWRTTAPACAAFRHELPDPCGRSVRARGTNDWRARKGSASRDRPGAERAAGADPG